MGGSQTRKIDVRVVAATNENLLEAVQQGRFRADLYYRLNNFPVFIPPLRERRQDIPLLIQYFLKKYTALYQKNIPGISDYGRELLLNHPWPGNIRELENVIERGVILTDHNRPIQAEALFAGLAAAPALLAISAQAGTLASAPAGSSNEAYIQNLLETDFNLDKWNEQIMLAAIQQSGGNISDAARKLGINRPIQAEALFAGLAAAPALLAISAQAGTLASAPAGNNSNETYIQNLLEADFNLDKWNEQIMLAAIKQSGGNISDAARKLGISRPTLAYQLKKYRQED